MKNISSFIAELESLRADMGKGKNTLAPKDKQFIIERKLEGLKEKEEQLQSEINKEIDDFFGYMNMKQANIEALNGLKEYVETEVRKLEQDLKGLNVGE